MALPAIEQDGRRMDWVHPLDNGGVGTDKCGALSACKKARTGDGEEARRMRVNGVTYMHIEEDTRKEPESVVSILKLLLRRKNKKYGVIQRQASSECSVRTQGR